MKRKTVTYATSLSLTLIFFIVGITGVLIFPGFLKFFGINLNTLPKVQIYKLHNWLGLLLILLIILHAHLHWKWIVGMTRRFSNRLNFKNTLPPKKITNYMIIVLLGITYSSVIITGIIKFPELTSFLGLNPLTTLINEISLIHHWSGVIAVFLTSVHLAIHLLK